MISSSFLVVGGSAGIGLALTRALVDAGAEVTVASRHGDALEGLPGVRHVACDVRDPEFDLPGLPERLDGLAYCPGTITLKPFQRLKAGDFIEDLQVNLLGAVRSVQLALGALQRADRAQVVLFSSVAAQVGMPFHASVAAAKGAVESLTRALAAEFAPGMCVNAIAPSLTDTPLARGLLATEEKRKAMAERHPLKRIGAPEEIAALASALLRGEYGWASGQVFRLDGGLSTLR